MHELSFPRSGGTKGWSGTRGEGSGNDRKREKRRREEEKKPRAVSRGIRVRGEQRRLEIPKIPIGGDVRDGAGRTTRSAETTRSGPRPRPRLSSSRRDPTRSPVAERRSQDGGERNGAATVKIRGENFPRNFSDRLESLVHTWADARAKRAR